MPYNVTENNSKGIKTKYGEIKRVRKFEYLCEAITTNAVYKIPIKERV